MFKHATMVLSLLVNVMPLVVDAIKMVEDMLPESGRGAEKLGMVRSMVEVAFDKVEEFEAAWPKIEVMIGKVVATFNALGIFKK